MALGPPGFPHNQAHRFARHPAQDRIATVAPLGVIPELQRRHFDVAHPASPFPLATLLKFVPPSQIIFGTDYPAETLRMINRGTAERLIPRFKS